MLRKLGSTLTGMLLGFIATGMLWIFLSEPRGVPVALKPPPTHRPLNVHVAGAVATPGVYQVPYGSIVQEALAMAGGPLEDAVLDLTNLAAPLADGQQVYIPFTRETAEPVALPDTGTNQDGGTRININLATAAELESLPGIGPSLAEKIIAYREQNGPFLDIEELLEVSGIGPAKLTQIRDLITIR